MRALLQTWGVCKICKGRVNKVMFAPTMDEVGLRPVDVIMCGNCDATKCPRCKKALHGYATACCGTNLPALPSTYFASDPKLVARTLPPSPPPGAKRGQRDTSPPTTT